MLPLPLLLAFARYLPIFARFGFLLGLPVAFAVDIVQFLVFVSASVNFLFLISIHHLCVV